MVSIELRGMRRNTGIGAGGPDGTVTFNLVVRSPLGNIDLPVTVHDRMDQTKSLEDARSALSNFADELLQASQHPLG